MKMCPKCGNDHEKKGTFCSRSCANARIWSTASKKKRGKTLKKYIKENPSWKENQIKSLDKRVESQKKTLDEKNLQRFLNGEMIIRATLKKWLVKTRGEKCECCQMFPEWNGKYLSLQVHHRDGKNKNNKPDNLMLLCPNCHSQTDTFAGKSCKKNTGYSYIGIMGDCLSPQTGPSPV